MALMALLEGMPSFDSMIALMCEMSFLAHFQ